MTETNDSFEPSQSDDRAVAARLARLRSMPVDTTNLDRMLRSQIPNTPRARGGLWSIRPLRLIAASVAAVLVLTTVILTATTGPALASPATMAQFHQDLVSGKMPVMQVNSIEAANRALAGQSTSAPEIPGAPEQHVMACCMKSVKNKRVACVLMKDDGVPITMTVANASDMKSPQASTVNRGGVNYSVQATGALNMVMTERHDRWICLIGELPAERLMDIASKLEF